MKRLLLLMLLLATGVLYAQNDICELKEYPKYKGKVYHQAVYDYIQYEFRNSNDSRLYREYHPVISFSFNEDNKKKKAEVLQTSGSNTVDRKILNLCKIFTRKKYMEPGYSEEGPIPCTVAVQFDFRWITPWDFKYPQNTDMGYREYYHMGYWNPAYRQYGTNSYAGYYNPSNNYHHR